MSTPTCITCGTELHPDRAEKYAYCTSDECQQRNATGLTMVAVGVNKSAEQFEILDDRTRDEMAAGSYHDQRRASYGAPPAATGGARRLGSDVPGTSRPATQRRNPWSLKQQRRALLYNEQGLRPDDIARRLGVSRYLVSQMILAGKNRARR